MAHCKEITSASGDLAFLHYLFFLLNIFSLVNSLVPLVLLLHMYLRLQPLPLLSKMGFVRKFGSVGCEIQAPLGMLAITQEINFKLHPTDLTEFYSVRVFNFPLLSLRPVQGVHGVIIRVVIFGMVG